MKFNMMMEKQQVSKIKNDSTIKKVNIPNTENLMTNLNESMKTNNINVTEADEPFLSVVSDWLLPLSSVILLILMFLMFSSFAGGASGQQKGTMTFGKSRARMLNSNDKNKITFDDVAGIDEEKKNYKKL